MLYDVINTSTNALFYNLCPEVKASTRLPLPYTKWHPNQLRVTHHRPLTTHHTGQVLSLELSCLIYLKPIWDITSHCYLYFSVLGLISIKELHLFTKN